MTEDGLVQLETDTLDDEAAVENWLTRDRGVTIGGVDVFIVHQQGHTKEGQRYDVIGLDKKGETVTIELKHNRSPRKMVAQAFEYASDHHQWKQPYSTLEHKFQDYTGRTDSLRQAHADYFDLDNPRPETAFNNDQRIILLAGSFSDRVLSVAEYLREKGHSIQCVEYSVYSEGGERVLATQNVLAEDSAKEQSNTGGKPSLDKQYRIPTLRRMFNRIQSEVVPELGAGNRDDPEEIVYGEMEDLNDLTLISSHPDISFDHLEEEKKPFGFKFRVVPTKGTLKIAVERRNDEVAEQILESYQDEVEEDPEFEYNDRVYDTIGKEADIDHVLAGVDWDTTTPEQIADVLLEDETVNQYIEEYVEIIKVWHPRIVEEYPETLAKHDKEIAEQVEP